MCNRYHFNEFYNFFLFLSNNYLVQLNGLFNKCSTILLFNKAQFNYAKKFRLLIPTTTVLVPFFKMNAKLVIVKLFFLWTIVDTYKILGIFPYFEQDHFEFFEPLMKALAKKGHDVTVISHFPQEEPLPNYTDVAVNSNKPPRSIENWETFKDTFYLKYYTTISCFLCTYMLRQSFMPSQR